MPQESSQDVEIWEALRNDQIRMLNVGSCLLGNGKLQSLQMSESLLCRKRVTMFSVIPKHRTKINL